MKLSSLGEFGLIELIRRASQRSLAPGTQSLSRLILGIGDDAAAWHGSELVQLATTDSLVEGVHFSFASTLWKDLGHKSLAVNLSDIAAMGGNPTYAFVSLCCPTDTDSDDVLEFYEGLNDLAAQHDVVVAGGNLTRAPEVTATIFVLGEVMEERMLTRSSAHAGQAVAITGNVGGASAAVAALRNGTTPGNLPAGLAAALSRPQPRLAEARAFASAGIRCAIDISDGLLADLAHVCEASNVSAVIEMERVPLHPDCADAAKAPRIEALTGGEDYELLVVGEADSIQQASLTMKTPVTIIGRIIERGETPNVSVVDTNGRAIAPTGTGWNHFQQ